MHKTYKSSTLVEVVVGMILIMLTMAFVFPFIASSTRHTAMRERLHATMAVQSTFAHTIESKDFSDSKETFESFTITKTVQANPDNSALQTIYITATNNKGTVLAQTEYIIPTKP